MPASEKSNEQESERIASGQDARSKTTVIRWRTAYSGLALLEVTRLGRFTEAGVRSYDEGTCL
jgi:hypothetical protein